uniref:Uncharacterized protein n=1 Tax=Peronospora matthiolae TaxID=2874970 RepID=A0AAV1VPW2_9STRA
MTYIRSFTLLAGLALSSTDAQGLLPESETMEGGYSTTRAMTLKEVAFLTTTACHPSLYNADVTSRICFTEFSSIQSQVVSGTNDKFMVKGCSVNGNELLGFCRPGVCTTPSGYEVIINSQAWMNTVKLTSIREVTVVETLPYPMTV